MRNNNESLPAMSNPTLLKLESIHLIRGGTEILKGIDWQLERGQHCAILGANGSGKTSLLKVLTGYEWPTIGSVTLLGERFGEYDLRELRKRVGWVSSSLSYMCKPEESVGAVALSGYDASIGLYREDFSNEEMQLAAETLRRLGADEIVEREWQYLSQGERQRTLIARALVGDPEILILDEPCAGLDPVAREKLLDDLEALTKQPNSPTILFVTHHTEEIRPYLAHTLAIKDGKKLIFDKTQKVLTSEMLTNVFDSKCVADEWNGKVYVKI